MLEVRPGDRIKITREGPNPGIGFVRVAEIGERVIGGVNRAGAICFPDKKRNKGLVLTAYFEGKISEDGTSVMFPAVQDKGPSKITMELEKGFGAWVRGLFSKRA
jgi:hypothetical protein